MKMMTRVSAITDISTPAGQPPATGCGFQISGNLGGELSYNIK